MDYRATIDVLQRTGAADPTRVAALTAGLARWGPSLAATCAAGSLRYRNRVAVHDDDGSVTWGQLDRRSSHLARGLHGAGVGRGAQLGILCRNHIDFVVVAIAAAKAGHVPIFLNTGSAAAQVIEIVRAESIEALVADADLLDSLAADLDGLALTVVVADGHRQGHTSVEELTRQGRFRLDPLVPKPAAPVVMTSGTTGTPKGARRRLRAGSTSAGAGILQRIPYRTSDVFVISAPLFHAWGLANLTLAGLLGCPVVLSRRFDPASTVALVVAHRASVLGAVPIMLQRILAADDVDLAPLSGLRIAATSGSALPAAVAEEWMDRTGDNLYNLYGSTEVGQATLATPEDLRHAPDTAGRAIPGCEVLVLDDEGVAVAVGESGRIFVGNGGQFDHYTGGGTREIVDGRMATGDVGHLDTAGRLFVTGRADDMIVSGGENVFPTVVESALLAHPSVVDCGVVGVDDDEFGQRLRAVVQVSAPLGAEDLRAHVSGRLGRHYVPRDFEFVDEVPRNASGKLRRSEL